MTAALTKQHEQEKHTRYRDKDEKNKSRRKQREKQKNRTQGVDSNKACRLCYKAEPGTLPPDLPSSSNSRQQWYQVPVRPLSSPASVNKSTETKPNYQDSGVVSTQFPLYLVFIS